MFLGNGSMRTPFHPASSKSLVLEDEFSIVGTHVHVVTVALAWGGDATRHPQVLSELAIKPFAADQLGHGAAQCRAPGCTIKEPVSVECLTNRYACHECQNDRGCSEKPPTISDSRSAC
jgi:hypothetical protein